MPYDTSCTTERIAGCKADGLAELIQEPKMDYAGQIQLSTCGRTLSKASDLLTLSTGVNIGVIQFATDKDISMLTGLTDSIDAVNGGQDQLSIGKPTLCLTLNSSFIESGISASVMEVIRREILKIAVGSVSEVSDPSKVNASILPVGLQSAGNPRNIMKLIGMSFLHK